MKVESVPNKQSKIPSFAMSGILLIISAVVFYNWMTWKIPSEDKLNNISGVVMTVNVESVYKSSDQLIIQLIKNNEIFNISQKNLANRIPVLKTLRQGDEINTLVSYDSFDADVGFIWEISRANETLLSRDQVFELAKPTLSQLSLALMALFGAIVALFMPVIMSKFAIQKN